jgi:hypothetical protein
VVLITLHSTTVNIKRAESDVHNTAVGGTEYISLSLGKGLKMHSLKAVHFFPYSRLFTLFARLSLARIVEIKAAWHNNAGAQMHSRKVLTKRYF